MIPLILRDNTYNDGPLTGDEERANLLHQQEAPEQFYLDPPMPGFLSFYDQKQKNLGSLLSESLSCILANWWDEVPGVHGQCHQERGENASVIKNIAFRRVRSKRLSKTKKEINASRKRMIKGSAAQKRSSKNRRKSAIAAKKLIANASCGAEGIVLRPWLNFVANIEHYGDFTRDRYVCNCSTCKLPVSSIAQPVSDVMLIVPADSNCKQNSKIKVNKQLEPDADSFASNVAGALA
ncbi:hypothetical protein NQZ79_g2783 [Umbelopsis isabellina]|nr:hypothetical protein NQZ79_g2783 [Umbelopsis isabellina]